MNQENGFTLVETMVTVAIVGVITLVAVPQYQTHLAKGQAAEAFALMEGAKADVIEAIVKSKSCTPATGATIQGKYGTLTITGAVSADALLHPKALLPTGCTFSYKLKNSDVSKQISNKLIVAQLFNNGVLSKDLSTSVDSKYLPKQFTPLTPDGVPPAPTPTPPPPPVTPPTPPVTPPVTPPPPPVTPPTPPSPPPAPPTPPTPPTPPVTPPVTPPPTETGTPTPAPSPDPSCNRWQGQMICADMGTWSCDVHNGDRRNGRSFYFQGEANNRNFLVPASQNMFSFVLRNGRCPATQAERESTAYNGVGVWCQVVDASKLQLNASCPAVNQKWNIFVGGIYDGLGLEWGTSQYLYPLNMGNSDDRAYFNGDNSEALYKRIYHRTAYEWGGKNLKGGYIRVNGTGSQFDIGRVAHTTQAITAFVLKNGRCPAAKEIATWAVPYQATTCMINQSLFTQYAAP